MRLAQPLTARVAIDGPTNSRSQTRAGAGHAAALNSASDSSAIVLGGHRRWWRCFRRHVEVECIGHLHRLGRQNQSTLISFVKFEAMFKRLEPGSRVVLGESQSGSQRAQPSGDAERRPATITPGERLAGRHRATSGDWAELIWEQEVAGSNPAIPTIFQICYR
jgi:hypothetical protein